MSHAENKQLGHLVYTDGCEGWWVSGWLLSLKPTLNDSGTVSSWTNSISTVWLLVFPHEVGVGLTVIAGISDSAVPNLVRKMTVNVIIPVSFLLSSLWTTTRPILCMLWRPFSNSAISLAEDSGIDKIASLDMLTDISQLIRSISLSCLTIIFLTAGRALIVISCRYTISLMSDKSCTISVV